MSTLTSEMESFKGRLKATWMAGDFTQIARSYKSGVAGFIERLNPAQGTYVLDVACGTGNLAIPAIRKGTIVTGVDIATNLLEQGRSRAQAEGLTIQLLCLHLFYGEMKKPCAKDCGRIFLTCS